MGIVCADAELQIDLNLIPEIQQRLPNSINIPPSNSGHREYKILVTIPALAIQWIT
jgi:hypothetical protein